MVLRSEKEAFCAGSAQLPCACCLAASYSCAACLFRGACGGGYAAFVFDRYSGELVEKLRSSLDDAVAASSMQAVRGTQTAKWNGRTILLQFDVTYRHSEYGTVTRSVLFTGHRVWFDTYDWSEPV